MNIKPVASCSRWVSLSARKAPCWALYESEKAKWIAAHPDATPQEYAKAVREIARKVGV